MCVYMHSNCVYIYILYIYHHCIYNYRHVCIRVYIYTVYIYIYTVYTYTVVDAHAGDGGAEELSVFGTFQMLMMLIFYLCSWKLLHGVGWGGWG